MRETAHWAGLNRPQYPSTFESPSETRDSRRGGNAAAESVWFPGSEQKRPVCDLVEETIEGDMRNRQHAIRLKGLAGRKRHAGVVTNTGYEIPLVGTWLDLTVRVADVDGGGAVERDRGCLCLKKILYQPFLCRRPTDMEHDSKPAGTVHLPGWSSSCVQGKTLTMISSAMCDPMRARGEPGSQHQLRWSQFCTRRSSSTRGRHASVADAWASKK